MLSTEAIQLLQSQNRMLQIELNDLNELIGTREEELDLLRQKAAMVVQLQSRLEMNLQEIAQMQQHIGTQQKALAGAERRDFAHESEMLQSIEIEKEYYSIKKELNSTKLALQDTNQQLQESAGLYKKVKDLESKVASLESNLEIAELDKQFLKEELDQQRQRPLSTNG